MEGLGFSTRLLAMAVMSLVVSLATLTSPSPTPTPTTPRITPTPTPARPPKNSRVYRRGEGCARKCMGLAEKSDDEFTGCTVGCMEPCLRSLIDTVCKCTISCPQTLSTQLSVSSMNELQENMSKCYNGCNKDFQLSKSDEKVLQMYWKLMENVRP